jgi:hypothetical protein
MDRRDVLGFRNQMEAIRMKMRALIDGGLAKEDAAEAIKDESLSWTQAADGLFMSRSIPGFYDELASE